VLISSKNMVVEVKVFGLSETKMCVVDMSGQPLPSFVDMHEINLHAVNRDEGTIVVFNGTNTATGEEVLVVLDHSVAQPIVEVLQSEDVIVEVETWQLVKEKA
jgi:hypothetical protein